MIHDLHSPQQPLMGLFRTSHVNAVVMTVELVLGERGFGYVQPDLRSMGR